MSTHTPGPWQISGDYNSGRKDGQRIVIICAPHPDGGGQNIAESIEANACLIAAAPDLLAVVEMITRVKPDSDPIVMFALIEKARAVLAQTRSV